ncbi:MAG: adenosylcobinamide-phosphate synthase CbiB [Nitrospiraceae bacterium]|nr:adenosylcobinamide-phosphate synthase CbiB [Nitrospiraceae bacterium]
MVRQQWFPTVAGYLLDLLVGEALLRPHPVALAGTALQRWEERCYRDSSAAGAVYVLGGLAIAESASRAAPSLAGATYVTVAHTMLLKEARSVAKMLAAGDIAGARSRVRSLVGRDTGSLGEEELARAVVESVAENTVDAVVAPLWWAGLAGTRGAYYYRMINTMDSQVGYRNARYKAFGAAAARLDDGANYLPARFAALLLLLLRPRRAVDVVRAIRRDAQAHPSPNAGIIEAGFAGALGVTLGGENLYGGLIERRGVLGDGPAPRAGDIEAACRLSRALGVGALVSLALARAMVSRGRTRR